MFAAMGLSEAYAIPPAALDPALDGVLVGGATLGGEVVGMWGGAIVGGVGGLVLCGFDGDDCIMVGFGGGAVVGAAVGGIGAGSLVAIPARVHSGHVATWTAVPAVVGTALVVVGLVIEPSGELTPIGAAVGMAGMPIAAGVAAAMDPHRNAGPATWTAHPTLSRDGAGITLAGRF